MSGVSGGRATALPTLIARDQKANSVPAQIFTAGVWGIRDINTVDTNTIAGASLASSVITLPKGTYEIDGMFPTFKSNGARARIYDVTNSAVLMVSGEGSGHSSYNGHSHCILMGRLELAAVTDIRIEQIVATSSYGGAVMGSITNNNEVEIYSQIKIVKVI